MGSQTYKEVEFKYVLPKDFNRQAFVNKISEWRPLRRNNISVRDTYYVLAHQTKYVYRHRFDSEIQQLTVKSLEDDLPNANAYSSTTRGAVRTEINIPIDQSNGDQREAVTSFLGTLGSAWQAEVSKDIDVFYFADCEIVFYRAVSSGAEVFCVEIEATNYNDISQAIAIITSYERRLGFSKELRESKSLFELLLLESAPSHIKKLIRSE